MSINDINYPFDLGLRGKKAVIFGVANQRSIAWAIAKALSQSGVEIAINYQNERLSKWVLSLAQECNDCLCLPCDINQTEEVIRFFEEVKQKFGKIDFLIHSVAFARVDDLKNKLFEIDQEGFEIAMQTSVFSFLTLVKHAYPLLQDHASILTMSYLGAQRAVSQYGIMGPAKAALEAEVKYLSMELGDRGIRVNAISAGPIKTLAASAIPHFREMLKQVEEVAPLKRNVSQEEVANSALFLLSPLSSAITGQVIYVDAGFHIMGIPFDQSRE